MGLKDNAKAPIDANVYANGQEQITGQGLNATLNGIVDILPTTEEIVSGIKGVATTSTVPSATGFERWLVHEEGTYTNFSGIVVTAADLDVVNGVANNRVILEVSEGVATKRVERIKGDVGPSVPIVQDLGVSTTAAMSQKGVTDLGDSIRREASLINNLVKNGRVKNSTADWFTPAAFKIVNDTDLGRNVVTNDPTASPMYFYQDIMVPEGDILFVSALTKLNVSNSASAYIAISNRGGLTGVVRHTINWTDYTYLQKLHTVPAGATGIRFNFQVNADRFASATDFLVLNLTAFYGAGNEPSLEAMQAILASSGGFFETQNLIDLKKANISYVDAQDSKKADKSSTFTKIEVSDKVDSVKSTLFTVDDYSLIGGEWTDGFFVFTPTENNLNHKLNITTDSIIGVDFTNLISKYGAGNCKIILTLPAVKNVEFLPNIKWSENKPLFNKTGTYILSAISDGANVIMYLDGFSENIAPTGAVLYVDNSGYTEAQLYPATGALLAETATRTASSWANPFKYLQNAINAAQAGDEVWVRNKTFKPTHLRNTTSYTSGDCKSRDAVFTWKSGVNVYAGFVGTETVKTQRGTTKTIISGDINNQVTELLSPERGDRRNATEITQSAKQLIYCEPTVITHADGYIFTFAGGDNVTGVIYSSNRKLTLANCEVRDMTPYASSLHRVTATNCLIEFCSSSASGSGAAAVNSDLLKCEIKNCKSEVYAGGILYCTAYNTNIDNCHTVQSGGGAHSSILHGCTITNCYSANNAGGAYRSTIYDSVFEDNLAANYGGAWFDSTVFRSKAIKCIATRQGGGWRQSNVTQCIAFMCEAGEGAGWAASTAINSLALSCKSGTTAGWLSGISTNCASINCEGQTSGWSGGTSINCVAINNKGLRVVRRISTATTVYNTLFFNNKTDEGAAVNVESGNSTFKQVFRNNAYDTNHFTGSGGSGSDINTASSFVNVTNAQLNIQVPSFVGFANTGEKVSELERYIENVQYNLETIFLKGKGINSETYPAPERDFKNVLRLQPPTIGLIE